MGDEIEGGGGKMGEEEQNKNILEDHLGNFVLAAVTYFKTCKVYNAYHFERIDETTVYCTVLMRIESYRLKI